MVIAALHSDCHMKFDEICINLSLKNEQISSVSPNSTQILYMIQAHSCTHTHTHIYSISRPFRLIFTSRALLGCSLFFRTAIWMNGSPRAPNLSCRHCIKTAKVGFCGCGKWLKEAMVKLIVFLLKRIKQ